MANGNPHKAIGLLKTDVFENVPHKAITNEQFEYTKEILIKARGELKEKISECKNMDELNDAFRDKNQTTTQWSDTLANSLKKGGVVVNTVQAFKDGLWEVSKALGDMTWDAIQKTHQAGGFEEVIETLVLRIGRAMFAILNTLVKMLHEAIMGMLKSGVIIGLKGAAGVLQAAERHGTRSYWHWLTVAGGATGYIIAAVTAAPALPCVAAGAVVGTAVVGLARWMKMLVNWDNS